MSFYLFVFAVVLWIIPLMYVLQSGSIRIMIEAAVLLAISMALPYGVELAEEELYGLAAKLTLEDALVIALMQLVLWLGGLVLSLQANRCNIPARMASRLRGQPRQEEY
jgi:hypothetical protein